MKTLKITLKSSSDVLNCACVQCTDLFDLEHGLKKIWQQEELMDFVD